jgi:uncharacterized protein YjbI with pentapeptide repeats
MPECRHHAICGLTDEADPAAGLCILHSHQADKDPDAFTTALRKHREPPGNRFTNMVFPLKADFTGESFTSAIFAKVTFAAGATFVRTTFGGDADFDEAIFAASADFSGATFDARPLFFTNFAAEANFSGATFNKGADFGAATFKELATFGRAKFSARTDFSRAKFFGRLNFSSATFQNPQPHVTAGAWVGFTGASFSGSVDFHEATFDTAADFSEATFKESLNLSGFVAGRSGPSTGQNRPFWLCSRWQGPTRHTRSSRPAQTPSADKSCAGIERSPDSLAGWFC